MSNNRNTNNDSAERNLTSWSNQPVDKYEYRRQLAKNESVGAGLFYAAAAGVAGSALVARTRSMPVKVLTPLTMAALTANYFMPAHSDYYLNNMGRPLRFGHKANVDLREPDEALPNSPSLSSSMADLKETTKAAAQDISQDVGAAWSDVKSKAEGYRAAGKEELSKLNNSQSAKEAKYWLEQQKAEVDRILGVAKEGQHSGVGGSGPSSLFGHKQPAETSSPSEAIRRRAEELRETPIKVEDHWWSRKRPETTSSTKPSSSKKTEEALPSAGSYNFFGWWRTDESTAGKPEMDVKVGIQPLDTAHGDVDHKSHDTTKKPTMQRRRASNADLHVAKEAVRGHDAAVTRGAMLGKVDAEDTGRKVHNNVIDATVPRHRQTRYEPHDVQETRVIYEHGGKKSKAADDMHGLKNLDRRAHMILNGVEHIEHSINKKMQKILQDEADFWHEQALKDEERARNMNAQANTRSERAF
ncbi:hypothetical protein BGZ73_006707 [Actinomortierella ambigua]|nr:hypothetical protein BGZ73_006707 [Actinomortierella ambigua]